MPRITPVDYRRLAKVFEKDGFQFQRQHGDHLVYTKPGIARPLVIPMYDQVPVFIIRDNVCPAKMTENVILSSSAKSSLAGGSSKAGIAGRRQCALFNAVLFLRAFSLAR